MQKHHYESWLENIYNTEAEEISCSECFDLVSRFVDLEFSGGDPASVMPQVNQHLQQCRACQEEYEILHDLRRLDETGKTPSNKALKDTIR